jgi:hypothetical protein
MLFIRCHQDYQIKNDEIGGARRAHGRHEKCIQISIEKLERPNIAIEWLVLLLCIWGPNIDPKTCYLDCVFHVYPQSLQ